MDLILIAAIVGPVSGAATVGTIALVRFARRFGKMEQSLTNVEKSVKVVDKEHEQDYQHYKENSKEIHSQLKEISDRVIRIETILESNMEAGG